MKNILLRISYDGTDYAGWQRQDKSKEKTIQGEVERALKTLLKKDTPLVGSGRTDSGVHARGQAANFISPFDTFPAENFLRALNALLPPGIRIMEAREVDMDFSARFSATGRTYRYFIAPKGVNEDAILSRYTWKVNLDFDITKLNAAATFLKGECDCATFCAAGDMSLSKMRYIEHANFFFEGGLLVFEITANAFLYRMIRSLVGTFVDLSKKDALDKFSFILNSRDRKMAGLTAPSRGLFLWDISFDGVRRHP